MYHQEIKNTVCNCKLPDPLPLTCHPSSIKQQPPIALSVLGLSTMKSEKQERKVSLP